MSFDESMVVASPDLSEDDLTLSREKEFASWLQKYVRNYCYFKEVYNI